jgi:hypothetical protein
MGIIHNRYFFDSLKCNMLLSDKVKLLARAGLPSLFTLYFFTCSSSIRFRSAFDDGEKPSACCHTVGLSMQR